jgi:hypothetical protein
MHSPSIASGRRELGKIEETRRGDPILFFFLYSFE